MAINGKSINDSLYPIWTTKPVNISMTEQENVITPFNRITAEEMRQRASVERNIIVKSILTKIYEKLREIIDTDNVSSLECSHSKLHQTEDKEIWSKVTDQLEADGFKVEVSFKGTYGSGPLDYNKDGSLRISW